MWKDKTIATDTAQHKNILESDCFVYLRPKSDHLMNESNASEPGFGQLWNHLAITYSRYLRIIPLKSTLWTAEGHFPQTTEFAHQMILIYSNVSKGILISHNLL